jgi:hypothetical protein
MNGYRVTWEMDFEADTPEEAATQALAVHRDPESTATVFDVWPDDGRDVVRVDVLYPKETT